MNDENANVVPPEPEEIPAPPDESGPELPAESPVEIPAPPAVPGPPTMPEPVEPPAPPSEPVPAPPAAGPTPSGYSPPPPPPPPANTYAPPTPVTPVRGGAAEKSKVVAGVLGILLGGLGIHKFYLGYTNEGIIMLAGNLLWIVGLGWVPNLIGLIEGVIYLFKTDQEFYDTYVVGTKKWF